MKASKLLGFTLGTLSAIGGFIDIGDLVADVLVGARFGLRLAWVTLLAVVGIMCYSEMSARIAIRTRRPAFDLVRSRLGPRYALGALAGAFLVTGPAGGRGAQRRGAGAGHRRALPAVGAGGRRGDLGPAV